jgi:futalosine hydrolase
MLKISAKVIAKHQNMERKYEICGMRILLTAATKFEIEPFIVNNKEVEVLITGVGVPATMYHLQKKLQQKEYDLVIQAGIAGTFLHDIELGEVVLVKQDTFADIGMEEKGNFETIFDAGFADKDAFPFSDGWLINSNHQLQLSLLRQVKAITINKVSDSMLQKQHAILHFSPGIESMEGAAFHYVCLQENIPFIQIRGISNVVGERDKQNWKIKESIGQLNKQLAGLVNTLLLNSK